MKPPKIQVTKIECYGKKQRIKGDLIFDCPAKLKQFKEEVLENFLCRHNNRNPKDIIPFSLEMAHDNVLIEYRVLDKKEGKPIEYK